MKRLITAILLGLTLLLLGPAEEAFAQRSRSGGGRSSGGRSSVGRSAGGRSMGRSSGGRSVGRSSSRSVGRSTSSRSSGRSSSSRSISRPSSSLGSRSSQSGRSSSSSRSVRTAPSRTTTYTRPGTSTRNTLTPSRTTVGRTSTSSSTPRTRYTPSASTGRSGSATQPGTRTGINTYTRRALTNTGEATRSPGSGSTGSARTPTAGSRTSGAAPGTSTPDPRSAIDLGSSASSRSSGRLRFPAPYRPAGTRSRSSATSSRSGDRGATRGVDATRTPTVSGATTRRSVDAYRGTGSRAGSGLTAPRAGAGSRAGSGTGTGTGSGTVRGAGKVRGNADGIRYGSGPVRRLTEPRTSASGTGVRGSSGKAGKARGTGSDVGNVSDRVRRNLEGAKRLDTDRPGTSDRLSGAGHTIDRVNQNALRASVGSVGGIYRSPYRGGTSGGYRGGYGGGYGGGYYGGYGGYWGGSWCGWGWGYSWGWGSWWGCASFWWPWYGYWGSRYYATAYPAYWSGEVYRTVYVEEPYPEEQVVEELARTTVPNSLSIAADRYLTLGDRAFREGRYTDAVQFYAKAVEYAPGEGAMYLVLADALFAAGDYHYGAYAIRRSFDLDPTLAQSAVDKHDFYPTPEDFDHQIAALETYLVEHPSDRDARLVLALNYLFGGRPAAAVDLLNSAQSSSLKDDAAAVMILKSAREAQYGEPVAPEAVDVRPREN